MNRRFALKILAPTLLTALISLTVPASATTNSGLSAIHVVTAVRHPAVEHVTPGELSATIEAQRADLLIIDVREAEEYAVSHITAAHRVSPDITAAAFQRRFQDQLKGRKVIVYCSVGVRSIGLANRIRDDVLAAGAASLVNLKGGLFAWHNEKRRLVDASGPTDLIHPYNSFWGTLIERDDKISYGPRAKRADTSPAATANR